MGKKVTKLLFLGNSFSEDLAMYVPEIAEEYGIDIDLHVLAYPACSVNMHIDFLLNEKPVYFHSHYNFDTHRFDRAFEVKAASIIDLEDWDYVVIQQVSHEAPEFGSLDNLSKYLDIIKSHKTLDHAKLLWQMTWSYPEFNQYAIFMNQLESSPKKMYEAILKNMKDNVLVDDRINGVIPSGTVVENLKNWIPERGIYRDAVHLTYHVGRYAIGLCFMKKVFGIDLKDIVTEPFSMPSFDKLAVIESAENAITNPYEPTATKLSK